MSTSLGMGISYTELERDSVKVRLSEEGEILYKAKSEVALRMNLGALSQLGAILAYGCGDGHQIAGIKNSVGYETNPEDVMIAKQMGVNVIADDKLLPNHHFDVVLCHHFLEKTDNVGEHILRMRNLINRKGKIVIVLSEKMLERNPKLGVYFRDDDATAFVSLLEDFGLRVVSAKHQFVGGFEKLAFLYRNFGLKTYYNAVTKAGQFMNNREWVFHAVLA